MKHDSDLAEGLAYGARIENARHGGTANTLLIAVIFVGLVLASLAYVLYWAATTYVPVLVPLGLAGAETAVIWWLARRGRTAPATEHAPTPPSAATLHRILHDDPRERIGRHERDAVINLLNHRYATEHLDDDEHARRHTAATRATTRGDLQPLINDLPT